jgi:hypothetical protein
MNLSELKQAVDNAIESAREYGYTPDEVDVSLQIQRAGSGDDVYTDIGDGGIKLIYDNDCSATGCVIFGYEHGPYDHTG